jgi:hypothetical protein
MTPAFFFLVKIQKALLPRGENEFAGAARAISEEAPARTGVIEWVRPLR